MVHETITLEGHLIDSHTMRRAFYRVVEEGGELEVREFWVGRTNEGAVLRTGRDLLPDPHALDRILEVVREIGGTIDVGDGVFASVEADGNLLSDVSRSFRPASRPSCASTAAGRRRGTRKMDSALVLRGGSPVLRQAGAGEAGRGGWCCAARGRRDAILLQPSPRLCCLRLHVERCLRRPKEGSTATRAAAKEMKPCGRRGKAYCGGARPRRRRLRGECGTPPRLVREGWGDAILTKRRRGCNDLEKVIAGNEALVCAS